MYWWYCHKFYERFPPFRWELGPGKKSQTKIVSIRLKQVAFVFWRYDAGGGKEWEGCRVRWNQLPEYLRGISSNIKDPFAILGNFGLLSRLMQILALFSLSHSTRSLSLFGGHCLNLRTFYHFYYSRLFPIYTNKNVLSNINESICVCMTMIGTQKYYIVKNYFQNISKSMVFPYAMYDTCTYKKPNRSK